MIRKNKKRTAIVIFKQPIEVNLLTGVYKTKDFLYKNVDYKKVMEYLMATDVCFQVGLEGTHIVGDYNHIEVYGAQTLEYASYERNEKIKENIENCIIKGVKNE